MNEQFSERSLARSTEVAAPGQSGGPQAVLMRIRLIGQMEAWSLNSDTVLPTGRKTRALLGILALSAPKPVLRAKLAELLWSRRPEEQARASLRQEIHRLMEALYPLGTSVIAINRDTLMLRPGSTWVDVGEVLRASPNNPAALDLLEGDLMEGLDGVDPSLDQWLEIERENLRDRARNLAESLLGESIEPNAVIAAALRLLGIDRTHEGAWRALMKAYFVLGERGRAVQTYNRCKAVLAELLDSAPSEETQRLFNEVQSSGANVQPDVRPPPLERPERRQPPEARPSALKSEALDRSQSRMAQNISEPRQESQRGSLQRGGARVGVMPLRLIGINESDSYLSVGLAEQISDALSRFRWLFVVASGSLARFSAETRHEAAIRRSFGIDFLLDGSVQREGDRLRVAMRLLDLRAGSQVVWNGRFDAEGTDLFSLMDDIATAVVGQIDPEILLIEMKRVAARPPQDLSANEMMLRAIGMIGRMEKDRFLEAGELLRQSVEKEPDFAAAHAWYAYWHIWLVGQGWGEPGKDHIADAERLAERAIALDNTDARALTIAGHVRAFLHHRLPEAIALHNRALQENPNLAMAWNLSGVAYAYMGELEEADRRAKRYKKLSPMDPYAFFYDTLRIIVALLRRDHELAAEVGREVSQMNPSFSASCRPYLAALGHLGLVDEAAEVRKRLLTIEPNFTVGSFIATSPYVRVEDRNHFAEGLRLAGLPE